MTRRKIVGAPLIAGVLFVVGAWVILLGFALAPHWYFFW